MTARPSKKVLGFETISSCMQGVCTMSSNVHWRQFSQAELDTQYNARATVSDIEAELKAYRD